MLNPACIPSPEARGAVLGLLYAAADGDGAMQGAILCALDPDGPGDSASARLYGVDRQRLRRARLRYTDWARGLCRQRPGLLVPRQDGGPP